MDITKYSQDVRFDLQIINESIKKLIRLLKHQGFYRKRYLTEKMNEDQKEAPFIKYKWEQGKMELR